MNEVEYTVTGWVENFKDYLNTNMSYQFKTDIKEFIGKTDIIFMSHNAFKRLNK